MNRLLEYFFYSKLKIKAVHCTISCKTGLFLCFLLYWSLHFILSSDLLSCCGPTMVRDPGFFLLLAAASEEKSALQNSKHFNLIIPVLLVSLPCHPRFAVSGRPRAAPCPVWSWGAGLGSGRSRRAAGTALPRKAAPAPGSGCSRVSVPFAVSQPAFVGCYMVEMLLASAVRALGAVYVLGVSSFPGRLLA